MSYTVGKSHAKKHPYRIFVRSGQTKETFTTDEQILAIVGYGMSAGLPNVDVTTDGDDEASITDTNKSYSLSTDGENGEVNFSIDPTLPAATAEDIIIIYLADNETGSYTVDVIDGNLVSVTLSVIGDYVGLVYRGAKWVWFCTYFKAIDAGSVEHTIANQITTFHEIGACKEKPSITGSEGEEFMSNTADSITISENLEVAIEDTQVNALNYAYLRSLVLANNGQVDFAFVDTESVGESTFVYDMIIKALPLFVGNDLNVMSITAKKEAGNLDNHFALHNE